MATNQSRWEIPLYSIPQINKAGKYVQNPNRPAYQGKCIFDHRNKRACISSSDQTTCAIRVINNWRDAHAYPLHVFFKILQKLASLKKGIFVAARLKGLDSILGKLKRYKKMKLCRMQDIAGCRMVLPTVRYVYVYSAKVKSLIGHSPKKEDDYIASPKKSGYRALHLIYEFVVRTPMESAYERMLVEIQFRTYLQHIWAAAVETVGVFTNQALKHGKGNEVILRFFSMVSSLFAIRENCTVVPGTSNKKDDLISELRKLDQKHQILKMLRAIQIAITDKRIQNVDKNGYYMLLLNYRENMLTIYYFKPNEVDMAIRQYADLENEYADKPYDIVLVRANSIDIVKASYPNYFMDIQEFIKLVEEYLQ